jgi:hypothetical protein
MEITKEAEVPRKEIERAIERKRKVEADFGYRTFRPG